jgi:hypothetical protein
MNRANCPDCHLIGKLQLRKETLLCRELGGHCSGVWTNNITMYDYLRVPEHLKPGEYVLGFRWDCESSAQIWQSCADVKITAPSSSLKVVKN